MLLPPLSQFSIKIKFVDLINLSFYRYSIFNIFLIAIEDKIRHLTIYSWRIIKSILSVWNVPNIIAKRELNEASLLSVLNVITSPTFLVHSGTIVPSVKLLASLWSLIRCVHGIVNEILHILQGAITLSVSNATG